MYLITNTVTDNKKSNSFGQIYLQIYTHTLSGHFWGQQSLRVRISSRGRHHVDGHVGGRHAGHHVHVCRHLLVSGQQSTMCGLQTLRRGIGGFLGENQSISTPEKRKKESLSSYLQYTLHKKITNWHYLANIHATYTRITIWMETALPIIVFASWKFCFFAKFLWHFCYLRNLGRLPRASWQ